MSLEVKYSDGRVNVLAPGQHCIMSFDYAEWRRLVRRASLARLKHILGGGSQ